MCVLSPTGDFVGDAVEKAISGGEKKEEEKGEGFGLGNVLSAIGGNKDEKNDDGFGVGDALKMVSGGDKGAEGEWSRTSGLKPVVQYQWSRTSGLEPVVQYQRSGTSGPEPLRSCELTLLSFKLKD